MFALLRSTRFSPLFWTQLLGAFNDNLLKAALIVAVTFGSLATHQEPATLVNLATALLVAPFFLFSALAGQLSDRFDKSKLIFGLKVAEVGIMLLAALGFYLQSLPMLLTSLFLMGTQSALFGPMKYAILPQHLEDEELLAGNSLIEMGTFLAILSGTLGGSFLAALEGGQTYCAVGLVVAAIVGAVQAFRIPTAPGQESAAIDLNPIRSTLQTVKIGQRDRSVWWSILGSSWFWLIGAVVLGQLPALAEKVSESPQALTALLAAFSLGVAAGSIACERLSHGKIELSIVGPAAILLGLALLWMASASTLLIAALATAAVGAAGGVFIVPLYAHMQREAEDNERSQVVAANNIVNAVFMVAGAGYAAYRLGAGASLSELFVELAIAQLLSGAVALYATRLRFVQRLIGFMMRIFYKIDLRDFEDHVPEKGAAIVICNHESFADAFAFGGFLKRPVRFVMDHRMAKLPGMKRFFRFARIIAIAPKSESDDVLQKALAEIDQALADGEVIALFPEGRCSRDGLVGDFRRGIERILEKRPVPVIPFAVRGFFGGFFAYGENGEKPMRRLPRRGRSPLRVAGGAPLGPDLRAEDYRAAVVALFEGHSSSEEGEVRRDAARERRNEKMPEARPSNAQEPAAKTPLTAECAAPAA